MNKQPLPYQPAQWDNADAAAIQACLDGRASPEQQKRAMNWIMYNASGINDVDYRTDSRDHAFVSGRRFVGLQVRKMQGIDLAAMQQAEQEKHNRTIKR